MGAAKERQQQIEGFGIWADEILLKFGAISACENHGDLSDNFDSGAVEDAAKYARQHPPKGMTPKEAAEFVTARINEIGDECGFCAKNAESD